LHAVIFLVQFPIAVAAKKTELHNKRLTFLWT
jgi:hypothetical protein